MRKAIGIFLCSLIAMIVALSCAQPYDMTSVLGDKTLTYSRGPDQTLTYTFAKDGKSGTYMTETSTYKYPDAASEGDYTKKAWVRTGGEKGTFTYNPETHDLVTSRTHRYSLIPGSASSYQADYKEYGILEYAQLDNPDVSAKTSTRTQKVLFNQDALAGVYVSGAANEWTYSNAYTEVTTIGTDVYTWSDLWTEKYTITSGSIGYSGVYASSDKENSTLLEEAHDISEKTNLVYAVYELGDSVAGLTFADLWKKDKVVTFRVNQTSNTYKEWEGATAPTAPTVDPVTGIGEAGILDDDPLNYYKIDNNTYGQTSMTFQHYGTFMTWFSSSANRSLK